MSVKLSLSDIINTLELILKELKKRNDFYDCDGPCPDIALDILYAIAREKLEEVIKTLKTIKNLGDEYDEIVLKIK